MYKQRNAHLLNRNGEQIFYNDIGRPLQAGDNLDLLSKINQIASQNSCQIIFKSTPGVVYALGSEIKSARQKNNPLVEGTTSSDEVIDKIKTSTLFPVLQLDYGLKTKIDSVECKTLKKDNLKDIRLKLNNITNFNEEGSVIYEERHAVQFGLGLLRPRLNQDISDNSKAHKPTPVTLLLGVFEADTTANETPLIKNLNEVLEGQTIYLGKLSVYNAFSNQSRQTI